jgi:hypothetical protein
MRFALNEMVEASGARLLLHAWGCEPLCEGSRAIGVTVQGKSGRFAILADVVIDATGDGDMFAAAGARFDLEKVLPWLWFRMGGVEDPQAALDAGGWFFRTTGDGQVLMPWGATERIIRKIDATDPPTSRWRSSNAARWSCARSTAYAPRSPSSAMPICATWRRSSASPRAGGSWASTSSRARKRTRRSTMPSA